MGDSGSIPSFGQVTNIKEAYVMFNGQKIIPAFNGDGTYTATITAPSVSSWKQENHVYLAEIHAEDLAGNTTVMTSTNGVYGNQLKIRVLEKTPPTVNILQPTQDAVLGSSNQVIKVSFSDGVRGSDIDDSTLHLYINGSEVSLAGILITTTPIRENGFTVGSVHSFEYQATGLSDGVNTVEFSVSDNDGNVGTKSISFIISTAAPLLSVTSPTEGFITNQDHVTVTGTTSVSSEYVHIQEVTVNGTAVTVASNGSFSTDVDLSSGDNTITVISKDNIGKTTSVTRNVVYDNSPPVITDVVTESTTVDVGGTIRITFKVSDVISNSTI